MIRHRAKPGPTIRSLSRDASWSHRHCYSIAPLKAWNLLQAGTHFRAELIFPTKAHSSKPETDSAITIRRARQRLSFGVSDGSPHLSPSFPEATNPPPPVKEVKG